MKKVFEIYIKTTPARLWKAITDTEMRRKYNFGAASLGLDAIVPLCGRRRRHADLRGRKRRSIRRPAGAELSGGCGARM